MQQGKVRLEAIYFAQFERTIPKLADNSQHIQCPAPRGRTNLGDGEDLLILLPN